MMCTHPYVKDASGMSLKQNSMATRANAIPFGCGRCLPCKINKAREWTNRLMLEASCYDENIFLTLTYDDDHLPNPPDVLPRDIQLFVKRLRDHVYPNKLRFFAVGEYGDNTWRPHYHLAIFNYSITDETPIIKAWTEKNKQIGHILIGDLNKDSARYIAGYCIKKLTNNNDKFTRDKLNGKKPEFSRSSRQEGGIGACAIDRISSVLRSKKYFDRNKAKVIRQCAFGANKLPLGRYLTSRLATNLDMGLAECYELFCYEEKLKDEHLPKDDSYYTNYKANLELSMQSQINSMVKKHRIHDKTKRRTL